MADYTHKLVEEGESDGAVERRSAPRSPWLVGRALKIAGLVALVVALLGGAAHLASQRRGQPASLAEPQPAVVGLLNEGMPGCTNGHCSEHEFGAACCDNQCQGGHFCFSSVDNCFLDEAKCWFRG
mmetsp:Transcript_44601/g.115391  ORF Transcript_44601/g.115391 Transcript_44601/m.115391 type:complete len:126 (+) Transcript_44601:46-423(+)